MKYDPNHHHRRSIRLEGYDYSQEGLYFITICTHDKSCLFGHIKDGEMVLSKAGEIAHRCWLSIPEHFPEVILHEHIVMPNHVHGIVELQKMHGLQDTGKSDNSLLQISHGFRSPSKTIGSVVRGYKIGVVKWFRAHTDVQVVWQRNYWEHIIRNGKAYKEISGYIISNPQNWERDKLYK